jgi:hypothetical protein
MATRKIRSPTAESACPVNSSANCRWRRTDDRRAPTTGSGSALVAAGVLMAPPR